MAYYIAFDYGTSSTGVAVGQDVTMTAQPQTAIKLTNGKVDVNQLTTLIKQWQPLAAIVMGLPRNQDGTFTKVAPKVQKFAKWLAKTYQVPVHLVDERNTSTSARELIFERYQFKGLKKGKIDQVSAALILQAYFDGEPVDETITPPAPAANNAESAAQ